MPSGDLATLTELANASLANSRSQLIAPIAVSFNELSEPEKQDFLERILILDGSPRIDDIPSIIRDKHMRSIRREHREFVFERLEGWWTDAVIKQLTHARTEEIFGYEVSDKLSNFAEEYKTDNLPITFRGKQPAGEIDIEEDPRLFVAQLREIGLLQPDQKRRPRLLSCVRAAIRLGTREPAGVRRGRGIRRSSCRRVESLQGCHFRKVGR